MADTNAMPTTIGGYRILRPLGQGGMARVLLADDPTLLRQVALKILPPEHADDEARARFLREAHALARVQHRNVVQVYASGVDGDIAWMALEWVEGEPLSNIVAGVDEETALSLVAQAARGLAAAHAQGVVHRDIKPENLILAGDGRVRVIDFGIAYVVDDKPGAFTTQRGVAVGTPHYMAPEQARGEKVDAKTDAWGLGATLFTLLVGRPPFFERADEADVDVLARIVRDRAVDVRSKRADVSEQTAQLVSALLEPQRSERPWDLAEVAHRMDALADAAAARAELPLPPDEPPATKPRAQRQPLAVLAVFAVLAAGVTMLLWQQDDNAAPRALKPPAPAAKMQVERVVLVPQRTEVGFGGGVVDDDVNAIRDAAASEAPADVARVAQVLAQPGAARQAALAALLADPRRAHLPAVLPLIVAVDARTALAAINISLELKSLEALPLLAEAERDARDAGVRQAAAAARQQIFSVDGR